MANDLLEKLLHEVALGKINVKDAKKALEGIDLEKDDFQKAVDFGVFTEAEPGTVIKATISPSGLCVFTFPSIVSRLSALL